MDRYLSRRSAGPQGAKFLAILIGFLLALMLAPTISFAQEPIAIVSGAEDVEFGASISFRVEVLWEQNPEHVWILYSLEGERAVNRALADFSYNGGEVKAEWLWYLEPGDIPPGTDITYYWRMDGQDGWRQETEERTFEYLDGRFKWQGVSEGSISVHYYSNPQQAESILQGALEALERLRDGVGIADVRPIDIFVYESQRDMAQAIPSRSETFDAYTVTLGMSMGPSSLVILGKQSDVLATVAHELSHAVVHQQTDNPFTEVPQWLDEGLAMYAEGELPADNAQALAAAVRNGRVLSLQSMTSYPGDSNLVDLYYGEAYSIASFMIERYGPEAMRSLLGVIAGGGTINEALDVAYNITIEELEAAWRQSIGLSPETSDSNSGAKGGIGRN